MFPLHTHTQKFWIEINSTVLLNYSAELEIKPVRLFFFNLKIVFQRTNSNLKHFFLERNENRSSYFKAQLVPISVLVFPENKRIPSPPLQTSSE